MPDILKPFALERFETSGCSTKWALRRPVTDHETPLTMKILTCPMNGPRNIDEFQSFGPVRAEPDPDRTADADWSRHLFRAENRRVSWSSGGGTCQAIIFFLPSARPRHSTRSSALSTLPNVGLKHEPAS